MGGIIDVAENKILSAFPIPNVHPFPEIEYEHSILDSQEIKALTGDKGWFVSGELEKLSLGVRFKYAKHLVLLVLPKQKKIKIYKFRKVEEEKKEVIKWT